VDAELLTVDSSDLDILAVLLGLITTDDTDGITLADRHGTNVVLLLKLLGEGSRHDDTTTLRVSGEVGLAALGTIGGDGLRKRDRYIMNPIRWGSVCFSDMISHSHCVSPIYPSS